MSLAGLLLVACAGPTPSPDQASAPSSSPSPRARDRFCREVEPEAEYVRIADACQNSFTPGEDSDPRLSGNAEDLRPLTLEIESEDGHYPPKVLLARGGSMGWMCPCDGDDEIPWRTNEKTFDPVAPFEPAEQEAVFEAERALLRASVEPGTDGRGGPSKKLRANINPSRLATVPDPGNVSADTLQPGTEPKGGAAAAPPSAASSSPNVSDDDQRGNRRFGARSFNQREMTFSHEQTITMRRTARFNTEVFGTARTIAELNVNAELNCRPPLPVPPNAPRIGRAWTSLTVLGQNVDSPAWNNISGAFPPASPQYPGPFFQRPGSPSAPSNLQRRNIVNRSALFFEARYRFMVGPVPMTVRASVQGQVGMDVAGNLDCLGMSLDAIGGANLNLTASWAINAIIIRAGIEGQLRLVDVSMHASASTRAQPLDGCVTWDASHGRLGTSLGGRLTLFTIVGFRWFQTRHDLNIADWQGIQWMNANQAREGRLCAAP